MLHRKKKEPAFLEISRELLNLIRQGEWQYGDKVPSERTLAEQRKISRGTARLALQELEKGGYIERQGTRHSIVVSGNRQDTVRLVFLSDATEISPDTMSYSNWTLAQDYFCGFLNACADCGGQLVFRSVPRIKSVSVMEKLVRELVNNCDGVLMTNSMPETAEYLIREKLPVALISLNNIAGASTYTYDSRKICRQAARLLLDKGYRKCGLIVADGSRSAIEYREKISGFTHQFADGQLEILPEYNFEIPATEFDEVCRILDQKLPRDAAVLPDVFLTFSPVYSLAFYRLAVERNWHFPDDCAILGYGNKPDEMLAAIAKLTYISLPYYEIGYKAAAEMIESVRNGQKLPELTYLDAQIVNGQTI
jgi:DNA-binding LacI/PurR family transcriptional regulator